MEVSLLHAVHSLSRQLDSLTSLAMAAPSTHTRLRLVAHTIILFNLNSLLNFPGSLWLHIIELPFAQLCLGCSFLLIDDIPIDRDHRATRTTFQLEHCNGLESSINYRLRSEYLTADCQLGSLCSHSSQVLGTVPVKQELLHFRVLSLCGSVPEFPGVLSQCVISHIISQCPPVNIRDFNYHTFSPVGGSLNGYATTCYSAHLFETLP
ncbi:hypothetical protein AVEN_212992-1 [Araneus ventricosus]|uniref:Uncharacterized protein n=1 Tax=Araneus ventricosus TaxID=182803 RepID=A0A4Y2UY13_ARAVE|nr:hypothetical protein AVEN_212992-1 [Araneus ventricosus]